MKYAYDPLSCANPVVLYSGTIDIFVSLTNDVNPWCCLVRPVGIATFKYGLNIDHAYLSSVSSAKGAAQIHSANVILLLQTVRRQYPKDPLDTHHHLV